MQTAAKVGFGCLGGVAGVVFAFAMVAFLASRDSDRPAAPSAVLPEAQPAAEALDVKGTEPVVTLPAPAAPPARPSLKSGPQLLQGVQTDLSWRLRSVRNDMPKAKVLELLGPPTWAKIPGDPEAEPNAVELEWDNGPTCMPIVVSFEAGRVTGSAGAVCFDRKLPPEMLPEPRRRCSAPGRARWCR